MCRAPVRSPAYQQSWFSFLQTRCPSSCPTNSVSELKSLDTVHWAIGRASGLEKLPHVSEKSVIVRYMSPTLFEECHKMPLRIFEPEMWLLLTGIQVNKKKQQPKNKWLHDGTFIYQSQINGNWKDSVYGEEEPSENYKKGKTHLLCLRYSGNISWHDQGISFLTLIGISPHSPF